MIEVKEAVLAAKTAAKDFLSDDVELTELLLEEVELDERQGVWVITLGFNMPNKNALTGIGTVFSNDRFIRKYKIFNVDINTGAVKSMKIRDL
jgi:hypothetical protein